MTIFYLLFLLAIGLITQLSYVQSIIYKCTVVEEKYKYSILLTAAGDLVKCLVLKKGIEGALPLLVIQGLEELLDGCGYLGLCGDSGAGGGDCTEQATPRAPPAPAARAAHAVAEVLQPQSTYI